MLESVYEAVLARALQRRGLRVVRQKVVVFEYDGMVFEEGLRVDLLVNEVFVVELKSIEALARVHYKQVLTYLRLMKLPVGLLINFGGATFKEGVRRIVNRHTSLDSSRLRVNRRGHRSLRAVGRKLAARNRAGNEGRGFVFVSVAV